jgi:hypothetical protein
MEQGWQEIKSEQENYWIKQKCEGKTRNTLFMFNNFFSKIVLFMRYVEKYCTAGQVTDGNMAHAHCMLDTKG